MSVLKSIALAIPAIKRLRDDRDALAREAERLRKTVASRSSLQTEDPGVVARVGKLEPLDPPLLTAEMFVAFSKKSPCLALVGPFSEAITAMTADGSYDTILKDATATWESWIAKN